MILLGSAATAHAGTTTPGLTAAFAARSANDMLPVLISLSDQVYASGHAEFLAGLGHGLPDVHRQVADALQSQAQTSQAALLKSMEILQTTGMARGVRTYWIVNMVSAEVTRAGAELVANMAGVDQVGLDETARLRGALETKPADGSGYRAGDGLTAIGAADAWLQGYRGQGRLIAVLADGAAANHPALAANWRGRAQTGAQSWFDSGGGAAPQTCGEMGTQLLGIACGTAAADHPATGVAPEAQWIAAKIFCPDARLSSVLAALQWAAEPDGNNATFADVPDAVINAWGLDAACGAGEPAAFWNVISNLETLGCVPVFSVADHARAASGSVRAPEAQIAALAVGNVDPHTASLPMHAHSARGPSGCDLTTKKPELVAPGTAITTASGASGYLRVTGTGAAAAHVAGAIALLRQANPQIPAAEIKRMLLLSARDLGTPGADNIYGNGLVDLNALLGSALAGGGSGSISGRVRYGAQPIAGAKLVLAGTDGELTATSAEDGSFLFDYVRAERGYKLRAARFGYTVFVRMDSIRLRAGENRDFLVDMERGYFDDAEFDQGWSCGVDGDNATGGLWTRAVPVGSRVDNRWVQPNEDAAADGVYCFVTGNASSVAAEASEADVDGGRTTLRSPVFSLTEVAEPVLSFAYWYSNDRGANPGGDFFRAQISNDGGANWINLLNTATSTNGWQEVTINVRDFVYGTERMRLQFIAEDSGPGSLVEAAVDNLRIAGAPSVPEPPRDLILDVQFDQVVLRWRKSPGAGSYKIYLAGTQENVVQPQNYYASTTDTTLSVPLSKIPYNEFYFQVTAAR